MERKGTLGMDYEEWYNQAVANIEERIKPGERFEVRRLFDRPLWDTLSPGERRGFGAYFARRVERGEIPAVEKVKKADKSHFQYI